MSKWELLHMMKRKRKYLTESDIVNMTKKSQPSVNRQLRSLVKGRTLEMKKKRKMIRNSKKVIKHYRYKR